jgi:uncharacterized protein (TIGR02679 family)
MNRQYLAKPEFAGLWNAARRTWERNGGLRGDARIGPLTEAEASELDGLMSWTRARPRAGAQVKVPLARLDERLRHAQLAASLQEALEALGGPLRDLPAERATAASGWNRLWADARAHRAAAEPAIAKWVERLESSGALKRAARGMERETLIACLDVLATLPRDGIELSRLASEVLGDAHALDYDTAVGGLVGAAIAYTENRQRPSCAAEWRDGWGRVGVMCDALSCNVLTLGLRPTSTGAVSRSLQLLADAGEPVVLTLRQVSRGNLAFAAGPVFVCENPAVISAAAEAVGADVLPLVCTSGWPNTAVNALLDALSASSCELRYQGDFDAEGAQIAEFMWRRHNATTWRFDVGTYSAVLAHRAKGPVVSSEGGRSVTEAIRAAGVTVYEEDIVDMLLDDVRAEQCRPHPTLVARPGLLAAQVASARP